MPSKDKSKQRQHSHTHYLKNKRYYVEKRKERKERLVAKIQTFKSTLRCCLCPENDAIALEFHHKDPQEKEAEVYRIAQKGRSWNKIVKEIEKCYCLCANCHRKVHRYDEWLNKLTGLPTLKVDGL